MKPWAGLLLCAAALLCALAPILSRAAGAKVETASIQPWPELFEGCALEPLPLTDLEQSFVDSQFPGAIARFTDGENVYILRQIFRPSRTVHSLAVCFEGAGWDVSPLAPERDSQGRLWSRQQVQRGETRHVLREIITSETGDSHPDPSAWYWAALTGKTQGPWLGISVVEAPPETE